MKITLVLAAVAAYAYADGDCCEDLGSYDPKCIPEALEGPDNWDARFTLRIREGKKPKKIGSDMIRWADMRLLQSRQCRRGARQFDAYCHQYNVRDGHPKKTPKYTDYTGGSGVCEYEDDLSQAICLGQQCMFEYCIWRRDEWIDECEEAAGDIVLPREVPGWGDVYDYGNMHDDLDTNAATAGQFSSDTCTDYYAHIDDKLVAINAELALAAGEDGEDDEDDEDDDDYY